MSTAKIDPHKSLSAMWDAAPLLAKAKAERVYMEEYSRSLKAILMKSSNAQSAAAQEREAYAHADYIAHLAALQAAVEAEEFLRWKMVTSQAAIDVWRSQNASNRAIDRSAA